MIKTLTTLLLSASLMTGFAQTGTTPFPKTITVTGSAEMELVPDEIFVQVVLKEYDKKGQGKQSIDKIKQDFLNQIKSLGLPDSLISIAGYDGYNGNPWLRKKNKKEELYASITYQLQLKSSKQVDDLVDRLDDNATQNFFIVKTTSSRMTEMRKNLKIEAIRAAKMKAGYLAEAINEKVGEAITINEPTEYFTPMVYNMKSNAMLRNETQAEEGEGTAVDFKKIKLKYEVTVVFALK